MQARRKARMVPGCSVLGWEGHQAGRDGMVRLMDRVVLKMD